MVEQSTAQDFKVYVLVGWNSYSSDGKSRGRTFFSNKRTVVWYSKGGNTYQMDYLMQLQKDFGSIASVYQNTFLVFLGFIWTSWHWINNVGGIE